MFGGVLLQKGGGRVSRFGKPCMAATNVHEKDPVPVANFTDFRNVFTKIRESLAEHTGSMISVSSNASQLHGIVPELLVHSGIVARQVHVGFFGMEVVGNRLRTLCEEHTDERVEFCYSPTVK